MEENKQEGIISDSPTTPSTVLPGQVSEQATRKLKLPILIGVIILLLLIVGGASGYFLIVNKQPQQVACTMEAKICSDGSAVGRTGPNCSFAPCPITASPSASQTQSNLKTFTGEGFSFQYSSDWEIDKPLYEGQNAIVVLSKTIRPPQPTGPFETLPTKTYLSIYKKVNDNNSNTDNWVSLEKEKRGLQDYNPEVKNIIVAGRKGIETILPSMNGEYVSVFFDKNDVFIIFFEGPVEGENAVVNTLKNQILSTFKFTDSGPTPTCMERPACLDSEPRCLLPETPEMCPRDSI